MKAELQAVVRRWFAAIALPAESWLRSPVSQQLRYLPKAQYSVWEFDSNISNQNRTEERWPLARASTEKEQRADASVWQVRPVARCWLLLSFTPA